MTIRKPGFLASVVGWVRKGYPKGIPSQDYVAVMALLRHRLGPAEIDEILARLTESGHLPIELSEIRTAISEVAQQEPTADELAQVAGRLATAGWPLATGDIAVAETPGSRSWLGSIVGWLRAGYPDGIPEKDYVPLVALLARRLTDDETKQVADQVVRQGGVPVGPADIGVLITKITNEMPLGTDIDRVRARLEVGGWHGDRENG